MTTIWTREELTTQIARWKQALLTCAAGKSYTIGSRTLTRHDLADIRSMLDYLAGQLAAIDDGTGPVFVQMRFPRGWTR